MSKPLVVALAWTPAGTIARLAADFPDLEIVDAQVPAAFDRCWPDAVIAYGLPPVERLSDASRLRWVQLLSAGVPPDFCAAARQRGLTVTNLAGLYGTSIAEHTLALTLFLARNLHLALRNQMSRRWDKDIGSSMRDLQGRTLAIIGLGSIGSEVARLARAMGMRVTGCRRTSGPAPFLDRLYTWSERKEMLREADVVVVAAPLAHHSEGMIGADEFAAMKRGVLFINVSRGAVAQEAALLAALQSGQVAAAGLDAYEVEPLPEDHPFWTMPQVIVSPHYSGDGINASELPAQRFARNLRAWHLGLPLEGSVDLEWGY